MQDPRLGPSENWARQGLHNLLSGADPEIAAKASMDAHMDTLMAFVENAYLEMRKLHPEDSHAAAHNIAQGIAGMLMFQFTSGTLAYATAVAALRYLESLSLLPRDGE